MLQRVTRSVSSPYLRRCLPLCPSSFSSARRSVRVLPIIAIGQEVLFGAITILGLWVYRPKTDSAEIRGRSRGLRAATGRPI